MLISDPLFSPVHATRFFSFNDPSSRSSSSKSGLSCRTHGSQSQVSTSDLGLGCISRASHTLRVRPVSAFNAAEFRRLRALESGENQEEEDDDLCPVECVKEFKTKAELVEILETARESNTLVVVDFYKTACGSCKYIEQGFIKLCKRAGDDESAVVFFKHNVMDEYEEQSEVAEELKIKVVPLFHFYKDGQLVESFPTREKTRILATISKYVPSIPNKSMLGT